LRGREGGEVCAGHGESFEGDGEDIRTDKSRRKYYEEVVGGGEMRAERGEMDN
jgi:hypothetical protein